MRTFLIASVLLFFSTQAAAQGGAYRVGEPLPDLVLYDARGEQRALSELLQGHYTVIVLGCLT